MRCGIAPIPRRMRTKEQNTQRERGGCEQDHLRFSKTGPKKKKTGKDGKTLRTAAARTFLATTPNPRKKTTRPRTPRAPNLRAQRSHCEKWPFQNELGSAAPRVFLAFETQFRQNFEHRTVQNSNTRKKLSSRRVRKIKPFRDAKRARRGTETRNRSETPCFVAFRVCPPQRLCCHKTPDQSREKRASGKGGQKNAQKASKMSILREGRFRDFLVIADFPRKPSTPFRTIKQAVSEDPDRLLNSSRAAY